MCVVPLFFWFFFSFLHRTSWTLLEQVSHSSSVYYGVSVTAFVLLLFVESLESLSPCTLTCVCLCVCTHTCCSFCAQAGSGSPIMTTAIQEFQRTESDRLNEVKGHLEIALLEKHFLREYNDRHGYHSEFTSQKLLPHTSSAWKNFNI